MIHRTRCCITSFVSQYYPYSPAAADTPRRLFPSPSQHTPGPPPVRTANSPAPSLGCSCVGEESFLVVLSCFGFASLPYVTSHGVYPMIECGRSNRVPRASPSPTTSDTCRSNGLDSQPKPDRRWSRLLREDILARRLACPQGSINSPQRSHTLSPVMTILHWFFSPVSRFAHKKTSFDSVSGTPQTPIPNAFRTSPEFARLIRCLQ